MIELKRKRLVRRTRVQGGGNLLVETKQPVSEGLAAALATYCNTQIALILEALQRLQHVHRGVHEARKAIRRLRSVIALVAPHFGVAGERNDAALRRLGRSLSQVRDAQVARDCARRKAEVAANLEQRELWQRVTSKLSDARTRTMRRVRANDPGFLKRQATIGRLGRSIAMLPWREIDPGTIRARLRRSRERTGRAADRYFDEPLHLFLHVLRRRLRRYRMQLAALAAIRNSPMSARASRNIDAIIAKHLHLSDRVELRVDQIGELLDTQLLRTSLRRLPASADRSAALALLRQHSPGSEGQEKEYRP